ncbi:MAG: hypothetical protein R3A49_11855 [Acidimicrobiia bacterium]
MRRIRTLGVGLAVVALLSTGCVWNYETLDGPGGKPGSSTEVQGFFSSAVVYNGAPHVFYAGRAAGTNWVLRHAYWNGSFWAFETLDGLGGRPGHTNNHVGRGTSAVLYNGRPHVFYDDETDHALRHAYWNGVAWAFETLDGNGGGGGRTTNDVGAQPSVMLYNGRPHLFYPDGDDNSLRHGYYNGVAWAFEVLDGLGGPHGRTTNIVGSYPAPLLYNGRPHVFYYDGTVAALRHAYWNGSFWAFETLDGPGGRPGSTVNAVGKFGSAVVYGSRPHVFYNDNDDDSLRHAYYNGVTWAFETLDGTGSVVPGHSNAKLGYDTAATLYGGRPDVYYGTDDSLRRAYYDGSAWEFTNIDGPDSSLPGHTNDSVGYENSVVAISGKIHVFNRDFTTGALRHVWFG